jgi:hypothetical protein
MKIYYFHDNPTLDFSINKGISPKISLHVVKFDKSTGLRATNIVAWSKRKGSKYIKYANSLAKQTFDNIHVDICLSPKNSRLLLSYVC